MKWLIKTSLIVAALTAFSTISNAACQDEVKEVLKAFESQVPMTKVETETFRNDNLLRTTEALFIDENNFKYSVVGGRNYALLRGNIEYNSNDGKNWEKTGTRPEGWNDKAKDLAKKFRDEITKTECGKTKKINGRDYKVFKYEHSVTYPAPIKSINTIYIDAVTNERFRWESVVQREGPPTRIIYTYTKMENITLPDPSKKD